MKTILLNPFSIKLEKRPFENVYSDPCYVDGDYRIYKKSKDHYLHCYKNIIICERCGINKQLLSNVKNDITPSDKAKAFHDYERPREAMLFGISEAKILNFEIK